MSWIKCRLGWVLAGALCCALAAIPLHAETEKSDSTKETKKPAKESPLVKASREIQSKKTGTAKTYSNEDLGESKPPAKVYTNDDLARMYGAPEEEAEATPAPEGSTEAMPDLPDPLAMIEQEKQSQAERQQRIAEAENALEAARRRLENLEVQLLATRNPFSARPDLSEEEKERRVEEQETAAERYERTKKMAEEARAEVAEAEANLAKARAQ